MQPPDIELPVEPVDDVPPDEPLIATVPLPVRLPVV